MQENKCKEQYVLQERLTRIEAIHTIMNNPPSYFKKHELVKLLSILKDDHSKLPLDLSMKICGRVWLQVFEKACEIEPEEEIDAVAKLAELKAIFNGLCLRCSPESGADLFDFKKPSFQLLASKLCAEEEAAFSLGELDEDADSGGSADRKLWEDWGHSN